MRLQERKNKRFLNSLTKHYSTMAKQIKEATETVVKVVRISGKTKPLAINGKENTDTSYSCVHLMPKAVRNSTHR